MAKAKRLSDKGFDVRFAKKDIDWIQQEASHRRLAPTHLIRMAVFDWFRDNAQTREPQTKKNEIILFSRFDQEIYHLIIKN